MNSRLQAKFTRLAAEVHLMLTRCVFMVFDVYYSETRFDSLRLDLQLLQGLKRWLHQGLLIHEVLKIYILGVLSPSQLDLFSHYYLLISIYITLGFKFIFNRPIFSSESMVSIALHLSTQVNLSGFKNPPRDCSHTSMCTRISSFRLLVVLIIESSSNPLV